MLDNASSVSRVARLFACIAAIMAGGAASAHAATYEVGPGRTYAQLTDVDGIVGPGDVVLLHGDGTYAGGARFETSGTAEAPIVIRGVPVGGRRPVIAGGVNTIEVAANHYVLEQLDLSGGSSRCYYHHGHAVVMRDSIVHDCPKQGILGADNDSGSLTLERVEVTRSGGGDRDHQIYMATDEIAHPGSVFRMAGSWVHDGNGGNNVKSRAERNEIYFNWLENAYYHELELIGADPAGGVPEGQAREDSDVVGNVLFKRREFNAVRFGGDATGQSNGRYRFAFNTVVMADPDAAVFRLFDGLETLEAYGNVLWSPGPGGVRVVRDVEAEWAGGGRLIAGDRNWVEAGSTFVPPEWTGTVSGADPGFVDFAAADLRPAAGSPLRDAGPSATPGVPGREFPGGLFPPESQPLTRAVGLVGRPGDGPLDIGAFEFGTPAPGGAAGGGAGPGGPGAGGAAQRPGFRRAVRRSEVVKRGRRLIVDTGYAAVCRAGGPSCRVSVLSPAGSKRLTLRAGATKRLQFTMKSRYAKALLRSRRLRVRLGLRASAAGAPAATLKRTLSLRAPR